MAFNDYIDSDYTVSGYFTGDVAINAVEGNATLTSVVSFTAEWNEPDMSYIDATYIEAGYFAGQYVPPNFTQEAGATLSSQGTFSVISNKIHSGTASFFNVVDCYANPQRIVQGEAVLTTEDGVGLYAQAVRDYELVALSNSNLSASGSKIIEATVIVFGDQTYIDGTYVQGGYFVAGIGVIPVITATLSALGGKVQQATTNIIVGGQYVDPDYIELGFFDFTLVYNVVGAFTLAADLELYFVPGIITGSANLTSISAVSTSINRQRDYNADMFSVSTINTQTTKILEISSDISVLSSNNYIVDRIRGYNSDIASEFNQVAINSRTRGIVSNISAIFTQQAYGARARDIDLFAFSSGALVAQANVVRDSNTLANTFFNIGTDFIRTRDVGANADSEISIINVPTRIRDTSLETQDAFSFVSTVVATRGFRASIVATTFQDNTNVSVLRDAVIPMPVIISLDIIPSITRNVESSLEVVVSTSNTASVSYSGIANLDYAFIEYVLGNAQFGSDMNAFDNSQVTVIANARRRAAADIFSVPGFSVFATGTKILQFGITASCSSSVVANNVRVRFNDSQLSSLVESETTAVKIHPLNSDMNAEINCQTVGVATFSFPYIIWLVADAFNPPILNSEDSRTRETGADI